MANEPTIQIKGNVSQEPELRSTQNGLSVVGLKVMQTPRKKVGEGWEDQEPLRMEVTVWREQAENVVASLPKGAGVVVQGRVTGIEVYQPKGGGEPRATLRIDADSIGPDLQYATAAVSKRARGSQAPRGDQGSQWGQEAAQEAPAAATSPDSGWATAQPGADAPWGTPGGYEGETPW